MQFVAPLVITLWAGPLDVPVPVHDGLQDGGEGSDPDPRADQHGVLGTEDVGRRRSERSVHENLAK